jgi:peptide/nickel transport system ATP-binding protein
MSVAAEIRDLRIAIDTARGRFDLVSELSFSIEDKETVALVGESGCGKSITALSLMRLLPQGGPKLVEGVVRLSDTDISKLPDRMMPALRGREISMIFQDPMGSLNPVLTVGQQLVEAIQTHQPLAYAEAAERAIALLDLVAISDPGRRFHEFPHRLSGGMCQRVLIAMAIACQPRLLIADEPTTALDVTIQAQILQLLRQLQDDTGMAMLFITHDLGVVAEMATRVIVMYAGRKVEDGPVDAIFEQPLHPYTQGLIGSTLTPGRKRRARLTEIPGVVPHVSERGRGCSFASRCPHAFDRCREEAPGLVERGTDHTVACWLHAEAR